MGGAAGGDLAGAGGSQGITAHRCRRQVDRFVFKDLFRQGARHGLITAEACERWLAYRDTRNETAHDHGEILAESTLELLPGFIADAKALADMIEGSTCD